MKLLVSEDKLKAILYMWDVGFGGRSSRMRHQSLVPTNNNRTRVIHARYNMREDARAGSRVDRLSV